MPLLLRIFIIAATAIAPMIFLPSAVADDGDVEVDRHGACTDASRWELDLDRGHGTIDVDYEVVQNASGDRWQVRLRHDGDLFFRGIRETRGPDGSFEVERRVNDTRGTDRFAARAVNTSTDELCRGRASI